MEAVEEEAAEDRNHQEDLKESAGQNHWEDLKNHQEVRKIKV